MAEKLAIVVSDFNREITSRMRKKAEQRAKELNAQLIKIVEVPGAFEIPLAVRRMIEDKNVQGIVTLGAIVKGDTSHDQVIAQAIANELLRLSVEYKKPVSLGIIGPNATWNQAIKRADEYALRAVDSVFRMLRKD